MVKLFFCPFYWGPLFIQDYLVYSQTGKQAISPLKKPTARSSPPPRRPRRPHSLAVRVACAFTVRRVALAARLSSTVSTPSLSPVCSASLLLLRVARPANPSASINVQKHYCPQVARQEKTVNCFKTYDSHSMVENFVSH